MCFSILVFGRTYILSLPSSLGLVLPSPLQFFPPPLPEGRSPLPIATRRLAYSSIFVRMQFTQRSEGTAKTKLNRRIRKTLSTVSDQKKCINIFVLFPFFFGQKSVAGSQRIATDRIGSEVYGFGGQEQGPLAARSLRSRCCNQSIANFRKFCKDWQRGRGGLKKPVRHVRSDGWAPHSQSIPPNMHTQQLEIPRAYTC